MKHARSITSATMLLWLATMTSMGNAALAQGSFSGDFPGPVSFTMGGSGSPLNAVDFGLIQVPPGQYCGLRVTYTVRATNLTAKPYDLPLQFYYNTTDPIWARPTVQGSVSPNPVVGSINGGPATITLDFPAFFYRSFWVAPIPFPGDMTIGLRARNLVLNNTATWSNIHFEFYPAYTTTFAGDNHSSGFWNRPVVNPRQGIDLGRSASTSRYTAFPFSVSVSGVYAVHSHFYTGSGNIPSGSVTYLFDGDVPVTGAYANLLDANAQGLYGVGYTDINSVTLQAGHLYTLVEAEENPNQGCTITAYLVGPGSACRADLDDDGDFANGSHPDNAVTVEDMLYFLTAFDAGDTSADLDNGSGIGVPDGGVTIDDLLFFLFRFEVGC